MLGNVIVGAFSVGTLAVIECMYCVHDSRVDLSGCPCFSSGPNTEKMPFFRHKRLTRGGPLGNDADQKLVKINRGNYRNN